MSDKTYIDNLDRRIFPYVEYPGYWFRYPSHTPYLMKRESIEEIRNVSEMLYAIFAKAAGTFRECPDEFMDDMDIPVKMRPYLTCGNVMDNLPTWLSRFDFVMNEDGDFKMVEINADTPCAFIEAYYGNAVAADWFRKGDPNAGEYSALKQWLARIFRASTGLLSPEEEKRHPAAFLAFPDYVEDYGTAVYLMEAMKAGLSCHDDTICFASFYDLAVLPDGTPVLPDGRTPSLIYRMHPMEILIEEEADDGSPLGTLFMDGYKDGRFAMINPPECLIMQAKGFQALLYALIMLHPEVFEQHEIDVIERYLPRSFFERDFQMLHLPGGTEWIRKPVWGREGRGIQVIGGKGDLRQQKSVGNPDDIICRDSACNLVQEFVHQPKISAVTDEGRLSGYLTLSTFMLGNRSSAVYGRFSADEIAGTEAYWIPILYE